MFETLETSKINFCTQRVGKAAGVIKQVSVLVSLIDGISNLGVGFNVKSILAKDK